jgi:NADH:ubiquinone oxidoreductase subunit 3 (subunit A)
MDLKSFEYNLLFIYFILSVLLGIFIFLITYFITLQEFDEEKLSAYECGFDPFQDARIKFDIQFYIIAILFFLFDLEIIYLIPWVSIVFELKIFGYFIILIFLILLFLGFFYEWVKNALNWQ